MIIWIAGHLEWFVYMAFTVCLASFIYAITVTVRMERRREAGPANKEPISDHRAAE